MPHKDKVVGRAWRKRWWASLSKERKRRILDVQNRRIRKVREFVAKYKLEKGCKDCGYRKHHVALDFDHIDGKKELNICFAKSIAQAKKEMLKCDVVCSNCHRIRSFERQYSKVKK